MKTLLAALAAFTLGGAASARADDYIDRSYTFTATYQGTEFEIAKLTADECAMLVARPTVEIRTGDGTSLIVSALETKRACVSTLAERTEQRAAHAKAEAEALAAAKAKAEADALNECRSLMLSAGDVSAYHQRWLKRVCFAADGSERLTGAKAALDKITAKVDADNKRFDAWRAKTEKEKRDREAADLDANTLTCRFKGQPVMVIRGDALRIGEAAPVKLARGSEAAIAQVDGHEYIFWEVGDSVRIDGGNLHKGTCVRKGGEVE